MRILADGLVNVLVGAQTLVQAAILGNDLAGAVGVQLIGGLGVQPGHGAAQAQTLGRDDADVAGGEGLAQNAGVELIHGLVGHGLQAGVTGDERLVGLGADLLAALGTGADANLALIHHGLVLALDLGIQHLAQMTGAEAGLESGLGHADADHVALAGMHDALDAVEEVVELTLDNRLEVGLPGLAGHLQRDGQADLGAGLELVEVGAVQNDGVILDILGFFGAAELAAVHAGAVDLDLGVVLADDLAFEGVGEGHGNVDIGDLDLDIASLQRGLDPVLGILVDNQGLGNGPHVIGIVGDDGEAQLDGTGAAGHGDIGHGSVGVDERENAVEGVVDMAVIIAGLDSAEDEGGADNQRDDVAHGPDILAHGDDADVEVHGHAALDQLVNDAADQEHEDTAGLVALDGLQRFLLGGSGADHDHEAGDIAGDQRHAQGTHLGIGEVAVVVGAGIGIGVAGILAGLDHLGGDGGANAGGEDVLGLILAGHHGLHVGQGVAQLAQGGDLLAQIGVNAGQVVGRVRHLHGSGLAQLGNDGVDLCLRLGKHLVGASEYSVK